MPLRGTIFQMGRKLQELFREAAELPERERAELAGLLLESLEGEPDEDVEAAWAEEIERRVRQIDSSEVGVLNSYVKLSTPFAELRTLHSGIRSRATAGGGCSPQVPV